MMGVYDKADPSADLVEALEELVDESSLLDVLVGLELVCAEKAEHIRTNWQDKALAKVWDRAAKACIAAARAPAVQELP